MVPPDTNQPKVSTDVPSLPQAIAELSSLTGKSVEGAASIALTSKKLEQVPLSVCVLTSIKRLDLSFNQLDTLPTSLTSLAFLSHLILNVNAFEEFPLVLCQMTQLETLAMQKNKIRIVPSLAGLRKLRELDLFMNKITQLDTGFGNDMPNLAVLLLRANALSTLPQSLGQLSSLYHLDLSSNSIGTIPVWLCDLPLRRLELFSCNLSNLDDAFVPGANTALSRSLEMLTVSLNANLSELPIMEFPRLFVVKASACNITKVEPNVFRGCPSLRHLDLDRNPLVFVALPPHLTQLETLAVCSTHLRQMPQLPNTSRLSELAMADTKMRDIPVAMFKECGAGLRRLYVQRASLSHVSPHLLACLPQLQCLSLQENQLECLVLEGVVAAHLHTLELASNKICSLDESLFDSLPSLERLDVACNKLRELPSSLWSGCPRLSYLNIFANMLEVLPIGLLKLRNLRELYAGNNRISALPGNFFCQLTELRTLQVSGNHITTLIGLEFAKKLEKLFAGRNQLTECPTGLHGCHSLETLDLAANRIKMVGLNQVLPALQELVLSHNKLVDFSALSGAALPAVRSIDLSSNPLEHIPSLAKCQSLEVLNLLYCKIDTRAASALKDIGAKLIYMQGNPVSQEKRGLRASFVDARTDLCLSDFRKEEKDDRSVDFSWSEIKGSRSTQEDTITVSRRRGRDTHHEYLFAVFDGHRGPEVSQHCAIKFPSLLRSFLKDPALCASDATLRAFQSLSWSIDNMSLKSGATCAMALYQQEQIVMAHLGDARAVLYVDYSSHDPPVSNRLLQHYSQEVLSNLDGTPKVVAIATMDHTPKNGAERHRVERDLGGYVSEQGRVLGDIAVTRALGDNQFAPYITNEPSILTVSRTGAELFMIVACDGLWDVVTVKQAYDLVNQHLEDPHGDDTHVALALRDHAYSMGSQDNISVIVISNPGRESPRLV